MIASKVLPHNSNGYHKQVFHYDYTLTMMGTSPMILSNGPCTVLLIVHMS